MSLEEGPLQSVTSCHHRAEQRLTASMQEMSSSIKSLRDPLATYRKRSMLLKCKWCSYAERLSWKVTSAHNASQCINRQLSRFDSHETVDVPFQSFALFNNLDALGPNNGKYSCLCILCNIKRYQWLFQLMMQINESRLKYTKSSDISTSFEVKQSLGSRQTMCKLAKQSRRISAGTGPSPSSLHFSFFMKLPTFLPTFLPSFLPPVLPAFLPAYQYTCIPTYLSK